MRVSETLGYSPNLDFFEPLALWFGGTRPWNYTWYFLIDELVEELKVVGGRTLGRL